MEQINLCDYPWIPIAGDRQRRSLFQLFSESSIRRLAGNAVDKIVVLRFLLCIVHAAIEIPDDDAWQALTNEKIASAALQYLRDHHDCFEMYGEHPFLQFPQLKELGGSEDPFGGLMVNVADGNKVVLTEWSQFRELSQAERIMLLLRSACYACGGKKYDKNICLSKGVVKKATGRGGTLLGFAGYLHSYLVGDTLLDTLHLNLLTQKDVEALNAFPNGMGRPFWEVMPQGEQDATSDNYRATYQGELFPIDKFLLFTEKGVVKTDGIAYPSYKDGLVDPALTVFSSGKDLKTLWTKTDTRPWRDLPAVLAFLESQDRRSPFFVSMGMNKLNESRATQATVWTGGMEVSSNSGEQYLSGKNDYVEAEFTMPLHFLDDNRFRRYKEMMQDVDDCAKRVYACVSNYYKKLAQDGAGIAASAKTAFLERMESRAQGIIDLAFSDCDEEAIREEKGKWFGLLCQVFDEFCPHTTPRQMTGWVETSPSFQKQSKKEGK